MKKKIILFLVISGLHFLFTLIWMRNGHLSCRGFKDEDCTVSNTMLDIALFPLGHLAKYWTTWYWGIDPLAVLMLLNSPFWGIAIVALSGWLNKKIMDKRK